MEILIRRRTNCANKLLQLDTLISEWCKKRGVETDMTCLNAEIICNPYEAEESLLEDIERTVKS